MAGGPWQIPAENRKLEVSCSLVWARAVDYGLSLSFHCSFFCLQILFLGPLMQLSMDCPCDLADGLKVVLGESSGRGKKAVTGLSHGGT